MYSNNSVQEDCIARPCGPTSRQPFFSELLALVIFATTMAPLASAQVYDTPPTSVRERQQAWRTHQQMIRNSPFSKLRWHSVGPRKQGGRVESVASPSDEPYTLYVGAGAGNIWKTVNNGLTWKPIFEHESTFAIGHIAIAPSDSKTLWVGTGEVLMARSSYAGDGVYKSTDGGQTWANMGLRDTHHIGRVVIHPENSNIVYVAAMGHLFSYNRERGLFKTTDGGKSWKRILYVNDQVGVVDAVMDPRDSQTVYAVTWQRSRTAWNHTSRGEHCGIHKTIDGGRTWVRLGGGLPRGTHVGRIGLDIAASRPDVLYALVSLPRGAGALYRSDDAGKRWRKVNQARLRADYDFCKVRVSPESDQIVHLPGMRSFRSNDGGKTFQRWGDTVLRLLDHDGKVLHLDTHDLWIDPRNPRRLVAGNDGGVFVSYDRGRTWLHLNNLPIGEFYAVTVDMSEPFRIFGGTQDNAALVGPHTHRPRAGRPDAWRQIYVDRWGGGDSYFTYADPQDPKTVYYEHQFGDLRRKNMKTGRTKDIQPSNADGQPELRFNWMSPFLLSRYDSRTLYFGANRVLKSTNRGDEWKAISPVLPVQRGPKREGNVPFGTITSLAESSLQRGLLVVGTDNGQVHVTEDDGKHWTEVQGDLPKRWVSRVITSSKDRRTLYATHTGYRRDDFRAYVFRSSDLGKSWDNIGHNLPAESVNVIREDPRDSRILYIGTDLGVYVSLDRGQRWHSLCCNLPTTPVHDLVVHPRDHRLVIATHGRSVFVMDVRSVKVK